MATTRLGTTPQLVTHRVTTTANATIAIAPRIAPSESIDASSLPSFFSISVSDAGRIAGKPSSTPPTTGPNFKPITPATSEIAAPKTKRTR